ncbi:MAG: hypothetical protein ACK5UC_16135 [Planctomycetaceae bacterium]|jgi:hypothetical protein
MERPHGHGIEKEVSGTQGEARKQSNVAGTHAASAVCQEQRRIVKFFVDDSLDLIKVRMPAFVF